MNKSEIYDGLSYNEKRLLLALNEMGTVSPAELTASGKFTLREEVMGAASWLSSKGLAAMDERSIKYYVLADRNVISKGLPERRALTAIGKKGSLGLFLTVRPASSKNNSPAALLPQKCGLPCPEKFPTHTTKT